MKNKIIISLTLISLILTFFLFQKPKEVVETKTITKIEYTPRESEVIGSKPINVTLQTIKVPFITQDTIEKVIYKDIKTNRYTYKDTLENGIIESTIFADNIHLRDVKLTTFDKTVEITTKETIVRNDWYIGGTITLNQNKNILNSSINVFYTHKGRFLLGTGIGYDLITKKAYTPITIAFNF